MDKKGARKEDEKQMERESVKKEEEGKKKV